MLLQKFRCLEAIREALSQSLLNNSRSCEADQAPGSAMITSPSIAKLAVTPPVVGSVKIVA